MKYSMFLIKYGEIGLKGKNKYLFEDALLKQIRRNLQKVEGSFIVSKSPGRVYVEGEGFDYEDTLSTLQKVFGIVGICPVVKYPNKGIDELKHSVKEFMEVAYPSGGFTFKVESRREDKQYPLNSMEINRELGGVILDSIPDVKVNVIDPEVRVFVEVRREIYVYSKVFPGLGGMPIGTAGSAMLLLSGGIDSPVAGYLIAKRGVTLEATYFHAPPYTSERAKEKVINLARLVAEYSGPIKIHIVNFTNIQLEIYEKCPHAELTIIMRRYMMKIAEYFAIQNDNLGLITGESIGQVASQTLASLAATNEVCSLPVYRPLIAFDKKDIVTIAEQIGTFETSILPYEDCCTIFVAKHPVTKPNLERIKKSEMSLKDTIETLLQEAIDTVEVLWVK